MTRERRAESLPKKRPRETGAVLRSRVEQKVNIVSRETSVCSPFVPGTSRGISRGLRGSNPRNVSGENYAVIRRVATGDLPVKFPITTPDLSPALYLTELSPLNLSPL